MNRVGEFEKVSFEQYYEAIKDEFGTQVPDEDIREMYENIVLPTRATSGSAGYDFKSPISFTMGPGNTVKIPTGIRVKIDEGWWLGCLPRSGLGFKYQVRMANTLGVVDSDYYGSSNEGHIFLKIVNGGDKMIDVAAGDGFAQCIFIPYGITYSDDTTKIRDGGFGSTGR